MLENMHELIEADFTPLVLTAPRAGYMIELRKYDTLEVKGQWQVTIHGEHSILKIASDFPTMSKAIAQGERFVDELLAASAA